MAKKQTLLSQWKQLHWKQKAFVIVQGANGIGCVVISFIALITMLFKTGFDIGMLIFFFLLVGVGLLGALGAYFILKGEKKGYMMSLIFQALLLISVTFGDAFQWEVNSLITLKFSLSLGSCQLGVDFVALACIYLVLEWMRPLQKQKVRGTKR